MAFTDDADLEMDDDLPEDDAPPPEESNNRTFLLILLVGVAAIVITLVFMIMYLVSRGSETQSARETQVAEINAQNTAVADAISKTAVAQAWTPTPSVTPIPNTPTSTSTPVVALPTNTATQASAVTTTDPRTATVAALLTLSAGTPGTPGGPTPTGLPDTGFLDDAGVTGLIAAAVVLVVVILLARRLRAVS
jgi:hypothetical protein